MPRISFFYSIAVYIFWDDHNRPHIHAMYNEYGAKIDIRTRKLIVGKLPTTASKLVRKSMQIHEQELLDNWERARKHEDLVKIDPLN